jgi:RNA polymerase sigma factor (sigma-70 family)
MSDYRVKISVSNARIRRAVEAAGYRSVLQMCKLNGLQITPTFNLVNMKQSPLTKNGKWRKTVLDLADTLNVLPDDLFNERQKVLTLGKNTSSKDVTESEMLAIAEQYVQDDRLEDLQDNSAVREIAEEQVTKLLNNEILDVLPTRQRKVLEMRFGFDGSPGRTLEEIGTHFGVSRERIRAIEGKALRRLCLGKTFKRMQELKELVLEHD